MTVPASFVQTVLGPIPASELGVTESHQHLFMIGGLPIMKEPDFRLDNVDRAVEELETFKCAGGQAIVDAMPLGCGRSPERLVEAAKRTGLHIIATTGFHKQAFYDDLHWIHRYNVDQLTRILIDEVETGMDEHGMNGPYPRLVDARAGAIKIATDYQKISSLSEKLIEAAVNAHCATGAPIITHTEHGTMGLEQAQMLERLGANLEHVAIGHLDRNPDLAYHRDVLATGVRLQYDTPGRIRYQPESEVIGLLRDLVELGFGDRFLLGGDTARRSSYRSYGGGPGVAYIVETFIPRLHREGFDPQQTRAFLVDNPAKLFAFTESRVCPTQD